MELVVKIDNADHHPKHPKLKFNGLVIFLTSIFHYFVLFFILAFCSTRCRRRCRYIQPLSVYDFSQTKKKSLPAIPVKSQKANFSFSSALSPIVILASFLLLTLSTTNHDHHEIPGNLPAFPLG